MIVNGSEIVEAFRTYALLHLILNSKYVSSRKPWTEQHCDGNNKGMTLWEVTVCPLQRSTDILRPCQRPCPTTHRPNMTICQVVVWERKRWGWRETPSPCGVTQHYFLGCMNCAWEQCQCNILLSNMQSATWVSRASRQGPWLGPQYTDFSKLTMGLGDWNFPLCMLLRGWGSPGRVKARQPPHLILAQVFPAKSALVLQVCRMHLGYEVSDIENKNTTGGTCLSPLQHNCRFTWLHRVPFLSMPLL